jgi:hypothetical protein
MAKSSNLQGNNLNEELQKIFKTAGVIQYASRLGLTN